MIGSAIERRRVAVLVAFVAGVCGGGSHEALRGFLTGEFSRRR